MVLALARKRIPWSNTRRAIVSGRGLFRSLLGDLRAPGPRSPAAWSSCTPPESRDPGKHLSYERVHQALTRRPLLCLPRQRHAAGRFQIDTREGILKGGQTHPAVVPGSERSLLIQLVSGAVPGKVMPARGPRLTTAQIDVLRAWIDQGLKFDAAGMAASWTPPLAPRRPKLPAARPGSGIANPIDRLLQPYFAAHKVRPAPLVDDRTYARRVYLDVIGMLPGAGGAARLRCGPPAGQARPAGAAAARRQQRLRRALADVLERPAAQRLRRAPATSTAGAKQITGWLYNALATNMPYDRFVAQLVNPTPESEGFTKGIVWRGVVNASQTPQMQAAQNISQVFMGVNLKCASCHDSFINNWKLADAYGMAGIYADGPLEMVRCDKPTGQVAPIQFIYPAARRLSTPRRPGRSGWSSWRPS